MYCLLVPESKAYGFCILVGDFIGDIFAMWGTGRGGELLILEGLYLAESPEVYGIACQPFLTPGENPTAQCAGGTHSFAGSAETLPEGHTHRGPGS